MRKGVELLLDDVLSYINKELIDGFCGNDDRYYVNCEVRSGSGRKILLRKICYIKRDRDNDLVLVNHRLSSGAVTLYFHFESGTEDWDEWEEIVNKFIMRTDVSNLSPPYTVKWENHAGVGPLKADERFDNETDTVEEDVSMKNALDFGFRKVLHDYIPSDEERFTEVEVKPEKIKTLYELDLPKVQSL